MPELQNDFVRNHLNEFAGQTIEKIQADQTQFKYYVTRIQTVRKEKAEKLLNGDGDDDDCDMFSDTTSMNSSRFTGGSRGTAKSFRSSKSKRKHERKLMSLKEGNPFEDIALIDTIYTSALNIYGQQQQIHDILKSLVDLELDSAAIEIQKAFNGFLDDVKRSLDVVWLPEMMVSGEIKVEEYMDYLRVQNEQHYAMISKGFVYFLKRKLAELVFERKIHENNLFFSFFLFLVFFSMILNELFTFIYFFRASPKGEASTHPHRLAIGDFEVNFPFFIENDGIWTLSWSKLIYDEFFKLLLNKNYYLEYEYFYCMREMLFTINNK